MKRSKDKTVYGISVFDLDRTLISSNCSVHFCRYLVSKRILAPSTLLHSALYYFRHTFLDLSLSELHRLVFDRFLQGLELERLEKEVDPFLELYLKKALYLPAYRELLRAQHLGHYTMILSNSPHFLVKKIAHVLGACRWEATEYAVDKEQRLCHIASIMQGEDKSSCVLKAAEELGVAPMQVTAYSDSIWDLPLLLAAGKAVAVRPDRKLRKLALEHEWKIL